MPTKFYRKLSPETKPVLANKATVAFKTNDHITGYFATDNEYVQAEFVRFATLQRYGITEISEEEYKADYVEKKNYSEPLRKNWREEIGPGASALQQVSQLKGRQNVVVAVNGTDVPFRQQPVVAAQPTKEQVAAANPTAEEFKPTTMKRGAAQK